MKKFLFLVIGLLFFSPAFGFNFDSTGHFNAGESVNIEIIKPQEDFNIDNYIDYISNLNSNLKNNWNPPTHLKSSKTVYIFEINPQKQVINHIKLVRTSGFKDVDRSALALLRNDIIFKEFPKSSENTKLTIKATFVRSVFGRPDVINNGAVTVLTKDSKRNQIKKAEGFSQKIYCRRYINKVTQQLKKEFELSDYPAVFQSVFDIEINRYGKVDKVSLTATSSDRNFNKEVMTRLYNTQFVSFPDKFLLPKINLEYKISNHLKKPSNK